MPNPTDTPHPHWSERTTRAIPAIEAPPLQTVAPEARAATGRLRLMLLARPLAGLVQFAVITTNGWWFALPLWLWFHYGSTTTAVHHLIHGSIGLRPAARRRWLTGLGLLILESGHAWQTTHLLHHRDGTNLPDPEGYVEDLPWRRLPAGALRWRFRIAAWGWRHGRRRRRTSAELTTVVALTIAAIAVVPLTVVPALYVGLMQLGTFLFAVLLAKGPHTGFGTADTPLTLVHSRVLGMLLFHHHFHLEHHAYPKVPMARLAQVRPHVEAAVAEQPVHHVRFAA
jgi:fatty acid desaturase